MNRDNDTRGGTRIGPGVWADRHGGLHVSVPELLDYFGWEDTPENRDQVAAIVREMLLEQFPTVPLVEQE